MIEMYTLPCYNKKGGGKAVWEADVQISKKKASFSYDYKPSKGCSWSASKNKYVRNSSTQYAMISYNAENYGSLVLDFNANFTYANDENARPWNVVYGSEKANSSYTWKIN